MQNLGCLRCDPQNQLFRLCLQVEIVLAARTAQRFGRNARRDIQPRIAALATKAGEKFLERLHDRLEIFPAEVGPRVVVDGLIDGPLLDAHRAVAAC